MSYLDIANEESFILQLQRMLRDISFLNYDDSSVGLTGIFDSRTQYAVIEFQKENGLPQSGKVDFETWQSINLAHINLIKDNSVPRAVSIFPRYSGYEISEGSRDGVMYVLQYMLSEISIRDEAMGDVAITGVYDTQTSDAIRHFKRRNLMDDTTAVDVETLNRIFDEYERIMSGDE